MMDMSPELIDRMVKLVQSVANSDYGPCYEAQAIMSALDHDVIEARAIIAATYGPTVHNDGSKMLGDGPARVITISKCLGDEYWEMRAVVAAIKRGRELERGE